MLWIVLIIVVIVLWRFNSFRQRENKASYQMLSNEMRKLIDAHRVQELAVLLVDLEKSGDIQACQHILVAIQYRSLILSYRVDKVRDQLRQAAGKRPMSMWGGESKPKPIEINASALTSADVQSGRYENQVVTLTGQIKEQGAIMELSNGFTFLGCSVPVEVLDMSGMTLAFVKKFVSGQYSGTVKATGKLEIERRGRTPGYRLIVEDKTNLSFTT